jgi:hypothetical protein
MVAEFVMGHFRQWSFPTRHIVQDIEHFETDFGTLRTRYLVTLGHTLDTSEQTFRHLGPLHGMYRTRTKYQFLLYTGPSKANVRHGTYQRPYSYLERKASYFYLYKDIEIVQFISIVFNTHA